MLYNSFISQYFKTTFNIKTIDSLRPRYCNSHIVLEEMLEISNLINNGTINYNNLVTLKEEVVKILAKDEILRKYYPKKISLITKKINLFNFEKDGINNLIQFLKIELQFFNSKYFSMLKNEILIISDKRVKYSSYSEENIKNILDSFISECLFLGISLKNLTKLASLSNSYSKTDIKRSIDIITRKKSFYFYLVLFDVDRNIQKYLIDIFGNKNPDDIFYTMRELPINSKIIPKVFKSIKKKRNVVYFKFKTLKLPDRDSGIFSLKSLLEKYINFAHIFSPQEKTRFFHLALVYDYSLRKYTSINYADVVKYKHTVGTDIENKISNCLASSSYILDKISSSALYLDSSLNEFKINNKFLNSWISIEVLFNTLKSDAFRKGYSENKTIEYERSLSTINCVYKYVPKIQGLFYISKIWSYLLERVLMVCSLSIRSNFILKGNPDVLSFIIYLKEDEKFNILINDINDYSELVYLLKFYREIFFDKKRLKEIIINHESKIRSHLQRLYRIRNTIVHGEGQSSSSSGLYNISSILMLSMNCREYSLDLINYISTISKDRDKYFSSMLDIFETFIILHDNFIEIIENTNHENNDLNKIINPFSLL